MKAKWTVMIYMAGDNDLDPAALDDIGELARVGSSEDVNVLVQLDRDKDLMTRRFRITKGGGYRKDCIETFGETNSGDPKVLLDFIDWSIGKYPADRYFLVLWNHGSGWWDEPDRAFRLIKRNIAYDDSSGGDSLDNQELKDVLTNVTQEIGKRVDIIGMDACLMTMVEVAYQLRESAMVMVGSEIEEPGDGWPYEEVIGIVRNKPRSAPTTMARKIVSAYITSYQGSGQSVTQSALNLEKIGDVVKALDVFSKELITSLDGDEKADLLKAIGSSWERSPRFFWDSYVDLYRFTKLLRARFSGERMNAQLSIDPIKHDPVRISDMAGLTAEVEMKVNQVSVLVSKKIGKNFCSWSLSYGATAEVEEEHFTEAIWQLDTQLRELVSTALPTPNGNGNGHGTHQPQLQG